MNDRPMVGVRDLRARLSAYLRSVSNGATITIRDGSEPRQPRLGDGYDLWQAILAATADVFVTHDERLAKGLNRSPVEGFRAIYVQRGLHGQLASALGL